MRQDIAYYLEEEVQSQPKKQLQAAGQWAQTKNKDHGRIEIRTCYVTKGIEWLSGKADWKKIAGIGMIVSERQIGEKRTTETSYFIYGQQGATAQQLLATRRSHWGIENKIHWVLDTVMREDESRARTGHGAENLNVLRHLALNLVKKETTRKGSMRTKLKICSWDHNYLLRVLQIPVSD